MPKRTSTKKRKQETIVCPVIPIASELHDEDIPFDLGRRGIDHPAQKWQPREQPAFAQSRQVGKSVERPQKQSNKSLHISILLIIVLVCLLGYALVQIRLQQSHLDIYLDKPTLEDLYN